MDRLKHSGDCACNKCAAEKKEAHSPSHTHTAACAAGCKDFSAAAQPAAAGGGEKSVKKKEDDSGGEDGHSGHICCHQHKKHGHSTCSHGHKHDGHKHDDHSKQKHSVGGCGCCEKKEKKSTFWGKYGKYFILGISFVALAVSFIFSLNPHIKVGFLKYFDIGLIAVLLCGTPLAITAVKKLVWGKGFSGKISSALLVTTAMLACIALEVLLLTGIIKGDGHEHTYMFAAGEIAFLMYLGEIIEDITVGKARSGIEKLVELKPVSAKYMTEGIIVEKPLSEVKIGDRVVVLPGDMVSVDGIIVQGNTSVDESVMTGESLPIDKAVGDSVYGGTWNKSGAITIQVTKAEDEMTVAKLKKLVEEAEGQKAPISRLTERAASFIVPASIFFAFAVFFINFIFMNKWVFAQSIIQAIERGVTMLVVLCPCALALATPVAVAAGLGNAAKNGILIKSGAALEQFGRVATVAFDKTGTLTESAITVDSVVGIAQTEEYVLRRAAAAESLSEHPLARAIAAKYPLEKAESVTSLVGVGVSARLADGKEILVKKWESTVDSNINLTAETLLNQGKTVVSVHENGTLIGIIALSDRLREGAEASIEALKKDGIKAVMLTGDNGMSASFMASQIGLDAGNVYYGLMPEDKLKRIQELKENGKVCMVGDGVNDAPALALADVSLAMGALGSDVAIETASAALLSSDIKKVPTLLRLGRKVLRTIKINIFISLFISVIAVILSTFGFMNPVWGAFVHNISSVFVALNSALLLKNKHTLK